MKSMIGRKVGMTQIFNEEGLLVPVTVVAAGPQYVTQVKTKENDGYTAVQVGFDEKKESRTNKPAKGHFAKAGITPKKVIREFKVASTESYSLGQAITVDIFAAGEHVDVVGTSKGKGTAGTVKRWNQRTGPKTHGSKYHRGPGSLGANSTPARVVKGQTLAGRLGAERCTAMNLDIVKVDVERNLLLIKGAIPGPKGGVVVVKSTLKTNK